MTEYVVGVLLALAVAATGRLFGLDRDRAFYPTVAIVVASYYALFAVMGASTETLLAEVAVGIGFSAVALIGFKKSAWLVAGAIAGHGLFDFVHHVLIHNPGVPAWWPGFCGSVDMVLGIWVGSRIPGQSRAHSR